MTATIRTLSGVKIEVHGHDATLPGGELHHYSSATFLAINGRVVGEVTALQAPASGRQREAAQRHADGRGSALVTGELPVQVDIRDADGIRVRMVASYGANEVGWLETSDRSWVDA